MDDSSHPPRHCGLQRSTQQSIEEHVIVTVNYHHELYLLRREVLNFQADMDDDNSTGKFYHEKKHTPCSGRPATNTRSRGVPITPNDINMMVQRLQIAAPEDQTLHLLEVFPHCKRKQKQARSSSQRLRCTGRARPKS